MPRRAFTLVELLIVIAIVGLLAGVALASASGVRARGRDGQRAADVATIMNAVYQYALDNGNQPPSAITAVPAEICKTSASSCTGYASLSALTAGQKYLVALPIDPSVASSSSGTGYYVSKNAYGRITVSAPKAETASTTLTR